MSHDYHKPGEQRVFSDSCAECDQRIKRGLAAFNSLDDEKTLILADLGVELARGGTADDASHGDVAIALQVNEAAALFVRIMRIRAGLPTSAYDIVDAIGGA